MPATPNPNNIPTITSSAAAAVLPNNVDRSGAGAEAARALKWPERNGDAEDDNDEEGDGDDDDGGGSARG